MQCRKNHLSQPKLANRQWAFPCPQTNLGNLTHQSLNPGLITARMTVVRTCLVMVCVTCSKQGLKKARKRKTHKWHNKDMILTSMSNTYLYRIRKAHVICTINPTALQYVIDENNEQKNHMIIVSICISWQKHNVSRG